MLWGSFPMFFSATEAAIDRTGIRSLEAGLARSAALGASSIGVVASAGYDLFTNGACLREVEIDYWAKVRDEPSILQVHFYQCLQEGDIGTLPVIIDQRVREETAEFLFTDYVEGIARASVDSLRETGFTAYLHAVHVCRYE